MKRVFLRMDHGQKPHLIDNGIRMQCNTENFGPIVVPGLSASSSSGSHQSISGTLLRFSVLHQFQVRFRRRRQHQLIMRFERGRIELKVISLRCLCQLMLTIERGNPLWTKPIKNTKHIKGTEDKKV